MGHAVGSARRATDGVGIGQDRSLPAHGTPADGRGYPGFRHLPPMRRKAPSRGSLCGTMHVKPIRERNHRRGGLAGWGYARHFL